MFQHLASVGRPVWGVGVRGFAKSIWGIGGRGAYDLFLGVGGGDEEAAEEGEGLLFVGQFFFFIERTVHCRHLLLTSTVIFMLSGVAKRNLILEWNLGLEGNGSF